jgi:VWFA-related protein
MARVTCHETGAGNFPARSARLLLVHRALQGIRRGVLVALLGAAAVFGQEAEPPDVSVVIRSTTSLVQVRLVAEDSKGKPVSDLRREDFEIQDNRKPQPITVFSLDLGASAAPLEETNAGGANGVEPAGYALIVLDWLNTKYTDRLLAKDQVIRLLKNFQPRQRVALYLLARQPRLILDFTSDMEQLAKAVEDAGLEPADMGDDTPGRFDARFGGPSGPVSVEEQLFHLNNKITDTLHTLDAIAGNLARVPGRKSLIWLSAAFPIIVGPGAIPGAKPATLVYAKDVDKVLQRLNRADVAVYGVDARGLPAGNSKGYPDTLQTFAERTGGTAFFARNDLDEGMRMALEDMRTSYILGFHVPDNAAAGVHGIHVLVKRPGVKLRYRESYQLQ